MQLDGVGSLLRLAVETLREPKRCLRIVLDIVITMPDLVKLVAAIVAVNTVYSVVLLMLAPVEFFETQRPEARKLYELFVAYPVLSFIGQLAFHFGLASLITIIGGLFKGVGTFKESVTALLWLQVIMLGLNVFTLLPSLLIPLLGGVISMILTVLNIYLFVVFIMEIHNFKNALPVFVGIIGTVFGLAIFYAILLILLGYAPEVVKNV